MRQEVSLPDLWSLSSRISRESWNTKLALQSHDDIKQRQIQKKNLSKILTNWSLLCPSTVEMKYPY